MDPETRKKWYLKHLKYRKTSKAFKRYRVKAKRIVRYKTFILGKNAKNFTKYKNGVEIVIDGKRVKTPIIPTATENDNSPYYLELFKQVYKELSKQ